MKYLKYLLSLIILYLIFSFVNYDIKWFEINAVFRYWFVVFSIFTIVGLKLAEEEES